MGDNAYYQSRDSNVNQGMDYGKNKMNKRKFFISMAITLIVIISPYVISEKLLGMDAISGYKSTYIAAGNISNQVKFQVSFKYGLFYPYDTGLYFTYTQINKWNIYDRSSPFHCSDYNPSLMYEKENFKVFDFIRLIPYEHKSNGKSGIDNRSTDRYFIESQISYGDFINIGIREKAGGFYSVANKNHDIKRYIGFFETEVFAQIKSRHGYLGHERISLKGEFTHKFYWYEAEFSFRIFTTKFRPHIYVQYFRGYGEFLIDYNKKSEALRAGLIFNPE
jgi:phospholipase A1